MIIGAMILAPLMGPVFGFSAGIQWGSWRLLLKSITTLAKGLAVVVLFTAALVVFSLVRLHPRCDEKEESVRAKKRAFGQIVISTVFLALISIPLVYFSSSAFRASVEKDAVFAVFAERMPEDKIYSWEITPGDPKRVSVVLLHRSDAKPDRGAVEAELSRKLQRPVNLDLFFIDRAEDGMARIGGL